MLIKSFTDRKTKPLTVDPKDDHAIFLLAEKLHDLHKMFGKPSSPPFMRAIANVELTRHKYSKDHFLHMARAAALDETHLLLPERIRARFNCDIDGCTYGYGWGTWVSWLLPIVWLTERVSDYPSWFDRLPQAAMERSFEIFYGGDVPEAEQATVEQAKQRFLSSIRDADWFPGFNRSNISGATLSIYFQQHPDSGTEAAGNVNGPDDPSSLQQIWMFQYHKKKSKAFRKRQIKRTYQGLWRYYGHP